MPREMILTLAVLLLGAWFLLVERQNFAEKIFLIAMVAVLYASYRVLTGVPADQIFTPVLRFILG